MERQTYHLGDDGEIVEGIPQDGYLLIGGQLYELEPLPETDGVPARWAAQPTVSADPGVDQHELAWAAGAIIFVISVIVIVVIATPSPEQPPSAVRVVATSVSRQPCAATITMSDGTIYLAYGGRLYPDTPAGKAWCLMNHWQPGPTPGP